MPESKHFLVGCSSTLKLIGLIKCPMQYKKYGRSEFV